MPRKWIIEVEPWPALDPERWYTVQVQSIHRIKKPAGLGTTLLYLDDEQSGRTQEVVLPLPVRPEGLTAQFFIACDMEVVSGQCIEPLKVLGCVVQARFKAGGLDGKPEAYAFKSREEAAGNGKR